jgi:hypothetical protein
MKKRFYIKTAFLSLTFMALLSSCLKDSKYYVNFAASKPLVELPGSSDVGPLGGPFQTFAFSISTTPSVLDVAVNLAAPKPLGSPLTVKLSVNADTLTKYNAANSTNYTLLPAADYSSTLSVTIPAGQNLVSLVVNINTSLIDPSQQYVLPLTITDGGGQQISNLNTILYNIQVKNAYDGQYTVTGTMNDTKSATITGAYPITADLITASATMDYMFSTQFGAPYHDILAAGAPNVYGQFAPVFTFSGTSITAVTNFYGQPAPDTRSALIDPTGVNATTGTPGQAGFSFKVKYIMAQASLGGNRTFFDETWTYVGPR